MHDAVLDTDSVPPFTTAASGGALYLVLTQVASRAFTFLANQFLLRYLSPSLLGLAVQLELLSVTVLYFGRESLRVALQRQQAIKSRQGSKGDLSQQVVNLASLAVGLGLCTFPGFGYGYLRSSSTEVFESSHFWSAFKLYAVATFLELISEPCFAVVQQHALYRARARAETTAAMARCVAACLAALIMSKRHLPASVLPFAIGQVSYATALLAVYLVTVLPMTKIERFSIFPRTITRDSDDLGSSGFWLGLFSKPLLSLAATFYLQSVFKLLLTNGDSLIISVLTDLDSQGAFALASNYGGLLSRLVFQPVEESSRNVFGRLISSSPTPSTSDSGGSGNNSRSSSSNNSNSRTTQTNSQTKDNTTEQTSNVDLNIDDNSSNHNKQPQTSIHLALTHLTTTLHIYTLFTLPLITILPPLLPTLTNLVLPAQWRTPETATLLTTYLYYLPFIAINGVLDAFVTSVATPRQLRKQSLTMACVTVVYGFVAWVLMGGSPRANVVRGYLCLGGQWGSPGLVLANMVNMAMRIAYSVGFTGEWVEGRTKDGKIKVRMWRDSLPNLGCVVVAVAVAVALRNLLGADLVSSSLRGVLVVGDLTLEDLGCVLGGVVVLGVTILIYEHQFLTGLMMPILPERLASTIRPYLPKSSVKRQ